MLNCVVLIRCSILSLPCPGVEKTQAFAGLLAVLHANQELVLGNKSNVYSLLVACGSWTDADIDIPNNLQQGFHNVFNAIRHHDVNQWARVMATFANNGYPAQALVEMFGLH